MPKMVRIGPAAGFVPAKGDADAAKAFAAVKAKGEIEVSYVTAMENVRNSGGMYQLVQEKPVIPQATALRMPEDMTRDELVLTALQLGIDVSKKQMKKAELVKAIRLSMEKVALLDDGDAGEEDGAD